MGILFRQSVLVAGLLILLGASQGLCQEGEDPKTRLQTIDRLLNQGDCRQAWQLLQEFPGDAQHPEQTLWRMACVQYEMGRVAASEQDAMRFYQAAEQFARAAIASNPSRSDGYKWLAIALGAQAKASDTQAQIQLSRAVKENIEQALALDPEDDLACLVLSRWHYKISALDFFARTFANLVYGGLPDASLSEAEKLLWRAISLHDRIAHRYHLAKVYERLGRREEAKAQLQRALLLPVTFPAEAEDREKSRDKLRKLQQLSTQADSRT